MIKFCIFYEGFAHEINLWRKAFPDLSFIISLAEDGIYNCKVSGYDLKVERTLHIDNKSDLCYSYKYIGSQLACNMCFSLTGNINKRKGLIS